ncbi:S-layer homology domain-containing protein [Halobacillus litoralis]|uniref:S-layer homology domain-containing protein n=1 Tax=Halobacillus litoralis TaxID=45668 RepID=UPI001CD3B135|nr:S-layer homology domain-containing protein [Halobacillus litoralis]MCA0972238.1 S-layer homology domain-containing protein [Halobacillus litoralis]
MRKVMFFVLIGMLLGIVLSSQPVSAEKSSKVLSGYKFVDWTYDEERELVFAALTARSDRDYDRANVLATLDAETMEVLDLHNFSNVDRGTGYKPTDLLVHKGLVYVANGHSVVVYDPGMRQDIDVIDHYLSTPNAGEIAFVDDRLYMASHERTKQGHVVPRLRYHDTGSGELTIFEESWYHISRPALEIDEERGFIYMAETDLRHHSPVVYMFDLDTLERVGTMRDFEGFQGSGDLYLDGDTIAYGNYLIDAGDLSNVKGVLEEQVLQFRDRFIVTEAGIYDRETLSQIQDLTASFNHYLDSDLDLYYVDYGFMHETLQFKKTNVGLGFQDLVRFEEEIQYLKKNEIINGFTPVKFAPQQPIKRIDAVRMIMREKGMDATNVEDPEFTDLQKGAPGYEAVALAKQQGIIDGLGDGRFAPAGQLKRSDMAKILANAYGIAGTYDQTFSDVPSDHRAYPFVTALAANGITVGYPDHTFRPDQSITRQEFAAFMARNLDVGFRPDDAAGSQAEQPFRMENEGYINNQNEYHYFFKGMGTPGYKVRLSRIDGKAVGEYVRADGYVGANGRFSFEHDLTELSEGTHSFTVETLDEDWNVVEEASVELVKETELRTSYWPNASVNKQNEEHYPYETFIDPYATVTISFVQDSMEMTETFESADEKSLERTIDLSRFEEGTIEVDVTFEDSSGNVKRFSDKVRKDVTPPSKPKITKLLDITEERRWDPVIFGTGTPGSDVGYKMSDGEDVITSVDYRSVDEDGTFEVRLGRVTQLKSGPISVELYHEDYVGNESERVTFKLKNEIGR